MPNIVLDVDENILKNKLRLTEVANEDQDLNEILKTLEAPSVPFVQFNPLPGLCIKTKTDADDKIFINLCHTPIGIPAPEDISDERFFVLLDEENPSWVIPMSIGNERYEKINDNTSCLAYDVAINSDFFKKIINKKHFLTFVVLTTISAIESKFDKVLNSKNYVILKNKKVIGRLQEHRVEKREVRKPEAPKRLIEEIHDKKGNLSKKSAPEAIKSVSTDNYVILRKPKEGNVEKLIGYFKLPSQASKANVEASVGEDRIVIDASSLNYVVDVFVPYNIQQDKAEAFIDEYLQILRLDMPVTV